MIEMATIISNGNVYEIGMSGSLFKVSKDYDLNFITESDFIDIYPIEGDSIKFNYALPDYQIVKEDDSYIYIRIFPSNRDIIEQQKGESKNDSMLKAISEVAKITAQSFTDEQALLVKDIYDIWAPNVEYTKDTFFTYNGELYKVNQTHTSQSNWIPGTAGTESLYTKVTLNESGYPIWKQPTGAHDAYNKGDIVEYNGELYISLIDGNAYSPDSYPDGWKKYIEE